MSTRTLSSAVYTWLKTTFTPQTLKVYPEFYENSSNSEEFATYSLSDVAPEVLTGGQNFGLLQPTITINVFAKDIDRLLLLTELLEKQHGKTVALTNFPNAFTTLVNGPFGGARFNDTTRFYQMSYNVDLYGSTLTI